MYILLADDHTLFRDGMKKILSSLDSEMRVHEASGAEEVFTYLEKAIHYSLILMDLDMPGMKGADTISKIKNMTKNPIVMISGVNDAQLMRSLFKAGVSGYIPKTTKSEVVLSALKLVISGGVYMPESLLQYNGPEGDEENQDGQIITKRQKEVLREVAKGGSNRDIAQDLDITEFTVRIHVASLLKAFDARNRTHLVALAREKGYL
jgi:DNA-binding NarL/FixJ family response regulator